MQNQPYHESWDSRHWDLSDKQIKQVNVGAY